MFTLEIIMKKFAFTTLFLILVFTSKVVIAEEISDDTVDRLIALSGLDKQMESFPKLVNLGSKQQLEKEGIALSEEEFDRMNKLIDQI